MCVQNDRLGVASFNPSNGQAGIVGQKGSDSDQDSVAACANLMGQNRGFRTAQADRLPASGRNAAVYALGIADDDKRSTVFDAKVFGLDQAGFKSFN